jgi:hypothetical protein
MMEDAKFREHLKGIGANDNGYNRLPEPFEQVTQEQFQLGALLGSYSFIDDAFAQVGTEKSLTEYGTYWNVRYFVCYSVVWAMCYRYESRRPVDLGADTWVESDAKYHDGYRVRYCRIGCSHVFTEKSIGICLHRRTCAKCGYSYEIDSSD